MICLEARSLFGRNGRGLAELAFYDEEGAIGQATQSLQSLTTRRAAGIFRRIRRGGLKDAERRERGR